ncbi:NrsF family protein [Cupriavidus sp. NPDC089707]|uniref:NrsF family protein n=1 Tax=Cupriavidus sp. NPDC089707 TaxID=3363963 RepID=UPI0038017AD5
MIPTPDLIDSLVADATPVRRLRPPAVRAARWLLLAALVIVLAALHHGVRPDLALKLAQPVFVSGVAAAVLTAVLAAIAAFIASVPGRSPRWLMLPVPAVLVWIGTIGYGCLTDWVRIGPGGISLGETASCFATLMVVGLPLSFAMLFMLRYVARLSPGPVAMCAGLAVAAMTATALSLLHPLDATVMILLWNFGVALLLVGVSGRYGHWLFAWMAAR